MKPISSLMMVIVFGGFAAGWKSPTGSICLPPPDALQALESLSGGKAVIDLNPETGLVAPHWHRPGSRRGFAEAARARASLPLPRP